MNKILTTFAILGVFLLGVVGTAVLMSKQTEKPVGSNINVDFLSGNFTPTSVSVSSTRQKLLSESSARKSAEVCNPNVASTTDNTAVLYILLSNASTSMSTSTGRPVVPGQCYDKIGKDFNYTGEVWALKNSATVTNVAIEEYNGN